MSPAEHLLVLISIILGLAVTQLLTSVHQLVRDRERVRFDWLPAVWSVLVFLLIVQFWWIQYQISQQEVFRDFFAAFLMLLEPITLFLAASAVLPQAVTEEATDMGAYYFRQRRWLFLLLSAYVLFSIVRKLIEGGPVPVGARAFQIGFVAMFLSLAWSGRRRYHALVTPLFLAAVLAFVFLFTRRMG